MDRRCDFCLCCFGWYLRGVCRSQFTRLGVVGNNHGNDQTARTCIEQAIPHALSMALPWHLIPDLQGDPRQRVT